MTRQADRITDKERLTHVIAVWNENPVLSNMGRRKWTRKVIDAAIRASRRGKGK